MRVVRGKDSLYIEYGTHTLYIYCDDKGRVISFRNRNLLALVVGVLYEEGTVSYHSEGYNVTKELLTLVKDPQNLEPHEKGLVKLKYGLSQQQLRIPVQFLNERGIRHDF